MHCPGISQGGESGQPWRGVNPSDVGRHWSTPRRESWPEGVEPPKNYESLSVHERLDTVGRKRVNLLAPRRAVFQDSSGIYLHQKGEEFMMS